MFCNQCGAEIPLGWTTCTVCGAPVPQTRILPPLSTTTFDSFDTDTSEQQHAKDTFLQVQFKSVIVLYCFFFGFAGFILGFFLLNTPIQFSIAYPLLISAIVVGCTYAFMRWRKPKRNFAVVHQSTLRHMSVRDAATAAQSTITVRERFGIAAPATLRRFLSSEDSTEILAVLDCMLPGSPPRSWQNSFTAPVLINITFEAMPFEVIGEEKTTVHLSCYCKSQRRAEFVMSDVLSRLPKDKLR